MRTQRAARVALDLRLNGLDGGAGLRGGTDYRSIRRLTVLCKAPLSSRDIRIARRCGPLLSRCGLGVVPA
ncbi:MAG: hypothetical protein PVJ03_01130 [Chromatiaceae bacterium]